MLNLFVILVCLDGREQRSLKKIVRSAVWVGLIQIVGVSTLLKRAAIREREQMQKLRKCT